MLLSAERESQNSLYAGLLLEDIFFFDFEISLCFGVLQKVLYNPGMKVGPKCFINLNYIS